MSLQQQARIQQLEEQVKQLDAKVQVLWAEKQIRDSAVQRTQKARKAKAERQHGKTIGA